MAKKPSNSKPFLSVQMLVLSAAGWGIISLLFFLLFSVPLPGQGRPEWYNITTYILENVAFLGATFLCFRNWRSSLIVSGRAVWLLLGLGMLSYFTGNLVLAYWELGLGREPDVSPGDLFFLSTYLLLGIGMMLAVVSRRLNLTPIQWLTVIGIGIAGTAIAYFTVIAVPQEEDLSLAQPSPIEQTVPLTGDQEGVPPVTAPEVPAESAPVAPAWAIALDEQLAPFSSLVQWLYILGDILLLTMATTLLLAFWGGRFSLSWRFIAASAFSFYIADIWFNYATSYIANYQTGALPEVCWIFSGLLVSIGAALEYDLSTRSRRTSRRRG